MGQYKGPEARGRKSPWWMVNMKRREREDIKSEKTGSELYRALKAMS